jgi:hypothetical protein
VNIRFVAVDENGREIEDDDDNLHPPFAHLDSDTIPRIGEKVMFYNLGNNRDATWIVLAVTWMVGAYRVTEPYNAAAHVCVMICKDGDET